MAEGRLTPFCPALSVAGLPECALPHGHEGAHVFAHVPTEDLVDRCARLLRPMEARLARLDAFLERNHQPDCHCDRCLTLRRLVGVVDGAAEAVSP